MNEEIRVVAAVADTKNVVFHLENGETRTLKQTDPRLEKVLAAIIGPNSRGEVAIVNLETFAVYKEYEEKSKGFVKFFKAAKSAVMGVFGSQDSSGKAREQLLAPQPALLPTVAPRPPAAFPVSQATETVEQAPEPKPVNNLTKHQASLKPMTSDEILPSETIVGVFGETIIPEMEKLKPYIDHALKNSSHEALENFFKRILPHIGKRGHSIQDLFRFMEKADMPIADDGTLIGYKLLAKTDKEGIFVDLHTKKVRQKVGSYVCVKEELVDRNRSNECSNGLHIARRGYISGFGSHSDQLTLIKLAPEDVVTVPHGDPSKVRAMGYHIVGLISDNGHILIRKDEPATKDNATANFIANVIKGNHIARIQEVRINGQYGTNITYTDLIDTSPEVITDETLTAEAFDHNGKPKEQGLAEPVNLKNLNKRLETLRIEDGEPPTSVQEAVADALDPNKPIDVINDKPATTFIMAFGGASLNHVSAVRDAIKDGVSPYDVINSRRDTRDILNQVVSKDWFDRYCNKLFNQPVSDGSTSLTGPMGTTKEILSEAVPENSAQRAARIKREKRAAKKVADEAAKKPVEAPKPVEKAKPAPKAKKAPEPTPAKPKAAISTFKGKPIATSMMQPEKPKVTPSKAKPKAAIKPEPKKETSTAPKPTMKMTTAEQARELYDAGSFTKLREFKKAKKLSWGKLNFTETEIKKITE